MITQTILGGFLTPYAIILSLSAAAGLGLSIWLYQGEKVFLLSAGLLVLAFSLAGGRVGFVLRNLAYFKNNLADIPQLWLGGLSWPGALLGAAISVLFVHWIWKESPGEVADSLLPLFCLVLLTIWMTGWGGGIGYGPETEAWFGIRVQDQFGLISHRWPLPILGAVFSTLWILGVFFFPLKRTIWDGFRMLVSIAGAAGINLVISVFRVDPAPRWMGLRWESWFSVLFLLIALGSVFFLKDNQTHD